MSTRTQQLFKSAQRKIDKILETRVKLARELREKRVARKSVMVAWENGK